MNNNAITWYISQFPESTFLCSPDKHADYIQRTLAGRTKMSQSNVLICGICRDVEPYLPYTISRITRLGKMFQGYKVYIYENDSVDCTKEHLNVWCQNDTNVTCIQENLDTPKLTEGDVSIERTRLMADARNKYLAYARSQREIQDIDYVIIIDMDLEGGWSYEGICNSFGYNDWTGIGSNSIYYRKNENAVQRLFFDAWAYRELGHPEAHKMSHNNLQYFERGESPIQVNSCFGGLCIYTHEILHERYRYKSGDCDHPTLNNTLTDNGYKIYMNPSQITLYNRTRYYV